MRMTGVATALAGWTDPMKLQLDPGALEKHTRFREAHELRLHPDADLGHITDWGSKLAGAVARIAGLLHVAWNESEAHKYRIGEDTMAAAITVGGYLTEHALAAFSYMGADPVAEDARAVLNGAGGRAWHSSPSGIPTGPCRRGSPGPRTPGLRWSC